jgi:beta-lactamase regulating signal transducer with metallopeptidase domain
METPLHNFVFKYQNWYLTPCCGLEVHCPTSALKSVKDPGNTFNLARSGQELCRPWHIFHGIFMETPSTICFQILKLIFDTLLWAWGALYHTRHLSQLKTRAKPLTKPKVGKNFAVLDIYFMRYLWRHPPQFVFKYQSWYLPPCCGIEVHYPT